MIFQIYYTVNDEEDSFIVEGDTEECIAQKNAFFQHRGLDEKEINPYSMQLT